MAGQDATTGLLQRVRLFTVILQHLNPFVVFLLSDTIARSVVVQVTPKKLTTDTGFRWRLPTRMMFLRSQYLEAA